MNSSTIKDRNINEVPSFLKSVGAVGRVDRIGDSSTLDLLKIEKVIDLDVLTDTGQISEVINHGMGKSPYILGSYHIVSVGAGNKDFEGKRGMLSDTRFLQDVLGVLKDINSSSFTVIFSGTTILGVGARVKFRFYLMREDLFDDIQN